MLQAFEWYVPADHAHWRRLEAQVPQLKATGVDNIWIPPGCKASSPQGNGKLISILIGFLPLRDPGAWELSQDVLAPETAPKALCSFRNFLTLEC